MSLTHSLKTSTAAELNARMSVLSGNRNRPLEKSLCNKLSALSFTCGGGISEEQARSENVSLHIRNCRPASNRAKPSRRAPMASCSMANSSALSGTPAFWPTGPPSTLRNITTHSSCRLSAPIGKDRPPNSS